MGRRPAAAAGMHFAVGEAIRQRDGADRSNEGRREGPVPTSPLPPPPNTSSSHPAANGAIRRAKRDSAHRALPSGGARNRAPRGRGPRSSAPGPAGNPRPFPPARSPAPRPHWALRTATSAATTAATATRMPGEAAALALGTCWGREGRERECDLGGGVLVDLPPPPPSLPRPHYPFGAASFPQASVPGEKRKLCFLLLSGERGASLSPGPGGTPRCYGGVVGCLCPPPTPTPPPPPPPLEVAVARSRSCLLRCLWDRGGLLGTASGSLVIYGRGRLIKERARWFAPSRTGARPVPLRWGKGAEGRTGSRDTECGSESAFRAFLACFAAPKERG